MDRKKEIIEKWENGRISRRQIAKELGLSVEYVSRIVWKYIMYKDIKAMLDVIAREVRYEKISPKEYESLNRLYEWTKEVGGSED